MLAWRMTDRQQQLRRFCIDLLRFSHTLWEKKKKKGPLLWKNCSAFVFCLVPPPPFPIEAPYKFLHSRVLFLSPRPDSTAMHGLFSKETKKNLVEEDLKKQKTKNHLPRVCEETRPSHLPSGLGSPLNPSFRIRLSPRPRGEGAARSPGRRHPGPPPVRVSTRTPWVRRAPGQHNTG